MIFENEINIQNTQSIMTLKIAMPRGTDNTLTLLNLACIKYTGHPLPVSDFDANNWKHTKDKPKVGETKKAIWSPHPYFNPIHLYYPSNDFGAQIMRRLVCAEIHYLKDGIVKIKEQVKKLFNPFNYKGKFDTPNISLYFGYNSRQDQLRNLFSVYTTDNSKPTTGTYFKYHYNQFDHRIVEIDSRILRNKIRDFFGEFKDVYTQKGDLRKKKQTAYDIYETLQLGLGMSCCSEETFFAGYSPVGEGFRRDLREWGYGKFPEIGYTNLIAPIFQNSETLSADDFVCIYNPSSINKQEKINQALIANFPN